MALLSQQAACFRASKKVCGVTHAHTPAAAAPLPRPLHPAALANSSADAASTTESTRIQQQTEGNEAGSGVSQPRSKPFPARMKEGPQSAVTSNWKPWRPQLIDHVKLTAWRFQSVNHIRLKALVSSVDHIKLGALRFAHTPGPTHVSHMQHRQACLPNHLAACPTSTHHILDMSTEVLTRLFLVVV
eukprot:1136127-Pelagomonas_calceolata.AAC.3